MHVRVWFVGDGPRARPLEMDVPADETVAAFAERFTQRLYRESIRIVVGVTVLDADQGDTPFSRFLDEQLATGFRASPTKAEGADEALCLDVHVLGRPKAPPPFTAAPHAAGIVTSPTPDRRRRRPNDTDATASWACTTVGDSADHAPSDTAADDRAVSCDVSRLTVTSRGPSATRDDTSLDTLLRLRGAAREARALVAASGAADMAAFNSPTFVDDVFTAAACDAHDVPSFAVHTVRRIHGAFGEEQQRAATAAAVEGSRSPVVVELAAESAAPEDADSPPPPQATAQSLVSSPAPCLPAAEGISASLVDPPLASDEDVAVARHDAVPPTPPMATVNATPWPEQGCSVSPTSSDPSPRILDASPPPEPVTEAPSSRAALAVASVAKSPPPRSPTVSEGTPASRSRRTELDSDEDAASPLPIQPPWLPMVPH